MKGEVKKITIKGKKSVKAGKTVKLKAVVKASKGANKNFVGHQTTQDMQPLHQVVK